MMHSRNASPVGRHNRTDPRPRPVTAGRQRITLLGAPALGRRVDRFRSHEISPLMPSPSHLPLRLTLWSLVALSATVSACDKPPLPRTATDSTASPAVPPEAPVPIVAEGKWKGIGRTELGTAVYVDSTSVRDSANARVGTFRIKHPKPFTVDSGRKSFVMSDADLIVVCGTPSYSVARTVRHYADLDGLQEVSRRGDPKKPWNVESPGTFGDVSVAFLCKSVTVGDSAAPTPTPTPAKP